MSYRDEEGRYVVDPNDPAVGDLIEVQGRTWAFTDGSWTPVSAEPLVAEEWVEECPVCSDLGHHVHFVGSEIEHPVGIDLFGPASPVAVLPARRVCECRAGHRFECEVRITPTEGTKYKLGRRA